MNGNYELDIAKRLAISIGDALRNNTSQDRQQIIEQTYQSVKAELSRRFHESGQLIPPNLTADSTRRMQRPITWVFAIDDEAYNCGQGDYTVMISQLRSQRPLVAVIYAPEQNLMLWASLSNGSWRQNGSGIQERIQVSKRNIDEAILAVKSNNQNGNRDNLTSGIGLKSSKESISLGLRAAYIATGEADLHLLTDPRIPEPYICAPLLIIEESGGKVTDIEGNPITLNNKDPYLTKGTIFSNGVIHDQAVKHTKNFLEKPE